MTPPFASTASPARRAVRRRRTFFWAATAALLLIVVAASAVVARLGLNLPDAMQALEERPPMDFVRYAERRLIGHPRLEGVLHPLLSAASKHLVREAPHTYVDLGKGQRSNGLSPQRIDKEGRPMAAVALGEARVTSPPSALLSSTEQIDAVLSSAVAGQVLEIAPGTYRLTRTLHTRRAGSADAPITVRAAQAGTVLFEVSALQAVVVSQPYWIFENLDWRGACTEHSACEHVYHVVGEARGTVIRNNRMVDFNAHLKINSEGGDFPDDGLVQFNTLSNTAPRQTDLPVTLIDLVGASGWQFLDNHIENFVKRDGNQTSYGMFMKGGGRGGRIERNLVVCTPQGVSQPGLRVGISLGGGGTGRSHCRGGCDSEHAEGAVLNNVVAHCNDAGIDIARASGSVVANNTLVNTQGIVLRNPPADATVTANLLEGGIYTRRGASSRIDDNHEQSPLSEWLADPDALDLRWLDVPRMVPTSPAAPSDFCGRRRPAVSPPGATLSAVC